MYNAKFILIIALLAFSGCTFYRPPVPVADYYYLSPNADLSSIGKVVLVQLDNTSVYPQISTDVTRALFEQIQKKQIFSLRVVSQDDTAWKSLELNPSGQYSTKDLMVAGKTLNCDAILIGTITEYVPYPHMTLGLHLKMIRCRDSELIWAFEQVWDTADKRTEQRIQKYLTNSTRSGSQTLGKQLATVSSLKFVKFIAYEIAMTM